MAATVYVGENWKSATLANPPEKTLCLDDSGVYWHLYRYFEGANLDRRHELVDLYGGGEIFGYQLDRLQDELKSALADVTHKPAEWKILTGWNTSQSRENEIWQTVRKTELAEIIQQFLWLITFAREKQLKVIVAGD
ncbi:MAG: hypothetical protein K1Y36_28980 [Blastocatellia bacterium]|nr:hypothetical protein [Blastocatellia bacterium]